MKRVGLFLLCALLLCGCMGPQGAEQKQYTATFLTLFDTVTTVKGSAESEEAFRALVEPVRQELERYHQLFDIYNEYDGMVNLKTVNDKAAIAPVYVGEEILDLLEDCKAYYQVTGGLFNPAMGSILQLWHEARSDGLNDPQNAYLPDTAALQEAALHCDPEDIVLDREKGTVYLADPQLKLDVGAIAKGWAVQKVAEDAPRGLLLSVGGNVVATGPKDAQGSPWVIGIQDPENSSNYLHRLNITGGSVVTSGSYQRAFAVDGRLYHHIIDPKTLYPGEKWTSITVVCSDSGLADVLSTTLFLMDREQGQALLQRYGAEALWVDTQGNQFESPGFRAFLRN